VLTGAEISDLRRYWSAVAPSNAGSSDREPGTSAQPQRDRSIL